MEKFKAKDVVAILIITGMVVFKMTGHNGTLDVVVAIIVGYYFAKRENNPLVVGKETATAIMQETINKRDVNKT